MRTAPAFAAAAVSLAMSSSCPPAETHVWETRTSLPEPLQDMHAALLDDAIWVAGGIDASGAASARVYRSTAAVQPGVMAWIRGPDLPAARSRMPIVSLGDSLYAVAGLDASGNATATLWVYRADSSRWSARASLPQPRGAAIAGADRGRLVVVGGVAGATPDSVDVYRPATNTWTRGRPIITPRTQTAGAVLETPVGPYLMVAGGAGPLASNEGYNIVQDGWAQRADMPVALAAAAAAASPTEYRLHVLGGVDLNVRGTHLEYRWDENRWLERPPMPTPRHSLAAVFLFDGLIAIGGSTQPGVAPTAVVEFFRITHNIL